MVADPVRWRILTLLAAEQLCTTHLQYLLGAKQTLVSHHLKVLRDAGLVTSEKRGTNVWYAAVPAALEGLRAALAP